MARSKIEAPIPIPNPIPNNKYDESFETLWSKLDVKKGSKWKAYQFFQKMNNEMPDLEHTAQIYNIQIKGIENTYILILAPGYPKRWENNSLPNLDEIWRE